MQNNTPFKQPPVVLAIAGSDSSGGAGIQADIKACAALGAFAATVITATTAQNSLGVRSVWAPPAEHLADQIDAVMQDLPVAAIKIGMVGSETSIHAIAERLEYWREQAAGHRVGKISVVLDPVMVASSGAMLLQPGAQNALVNRLIPLADLITPNLPEARWLRGGDPDPKTSGDHANDNRALLDSLASMFPTQHILLKDGHGSGQRIVDLLHLAHESIPLALESRRIDSNNTHGTGCSLSSAIAALRAHGLTWSEAVRGAQTYVFRAIEASQSWKICAGHGPLQHFHSLVAHS